MTAPDIRVEFNFSGSTWTDVSSYVLTGDESVRFTRGRRKFGDQPAIGEASFVLNNSDGRFTPANSSGAYYPNVKKRIGVRIYVDGSSITYRVWTGFVDRWRVKLRGPLVVTEVECSDALRKAYSTVFQSLGVEQAAYVANANGGACWPMADFDATIGDEWAPWRNTSASNISILGGWLGGASGSHDFVEDAPRFMKGSISLKRDEASALGPVLKPPITFDPGSGGAVGVWFKIESGVSGLLWRMDRQVADVTTALLQLQLNSSGALVLTATNDSGNTATLTRSTSPMTGTRMDDGQWHYALAGVDTDGVTLRIFVDGTAYTTTAGSARTISATNRRLVVGGYWLHNSAVSFGCCQGNYAGVAVIPGYMPTATERTAMWNAGSNGFSGDTITARKDRLLSYVDNPYTITVADVTSGFTVGGQETSGKSLAELMGEIAYAELGAFYADYAGDLQYRGFAAVTATVDLTLDGPSDLVGQDIDYDADDAGYYNVLTAEGPAGSVYREDATALAADGVVSQSVSNVVCETLTQLGAWADQVLALAVDSSPLLTRARVDLLAGVLSGTTVRQVCRTAMTERVQLTGMPSAAFGTTSLYGFVQGYQVELSAHRCEMDMYLW